MKYADVFAKGFYNWRILVENGDKIYFFNKFLLPFCAEFDKDRLASFDADYRHWLTKLLPLFGSFVPIIATFLPGPVLLYVYFHPVMFLYLVVDIANVVEALSMIVILYMPLKRISVRFLNPFSKNCHFTYYPNILSVVIFLVEFYVISVSVFLLAMGTKTSFLMNLFYCASLLLALPLGSLATVGVWKLLRHDY